MGDLEDRAREFATEAHNSIDQRRKYPSQPYIVHPLFRGGLVRSGPHTEEMIAAALLHDVVEDTPVMIDEIREEVGNKMNLWIG